MAVQVAKPLVVAALLALFSPQLAHPAHALRIAGLRGHRRPATTSDGPNFSEPDCATTELDSDVGNIDSVIIPTATRQLNLANTSQDVGLGPEG